jgi:two-component system OmpR family response regulator
VIGALDSRSPVILVVEDDDAVRCSLTAALEYEGYQVTAERDGLRLDELLRQVHPDLAVLDVYLPEGPDGFAIGRRLRSAGSVALLFLTAADEIENRIKGFEVGADDYVVKPFALSELLMRIRAVLRRSGRQVARSLRVRDLLLDEDDRVVTRGGEPIPVTDMEYELLRALVRSAGTVLSKEQLLAQVWGFGGYNPNLVEVYVSSVRRKLEQHGPRLIYTERGRGYIVRP